MANFIEQQKIASNDSMTVHDDGAGDYQPEYRISVDRGERRRRRHPDRHRPMPPTPVGMPPTPLCLPPPTKVGYEVW